MHVCTESTVELGYPGVKHEWMHTGNVGSESSELNPGSADASSYAQQGRALGKGETMVLATTLARKEAFEG